MTHVPTFSDWQNGDVPTVHFDGEAQQTPFDLERVQVAWERVENGYVSGMVNSAAIDWSGRDLTVTISTGDPRGAFAMTVRAMDDGTMLLHVPHPSSTMPHETLHEIHPGTYRIGPEGRLAPEDDDD